MKISIDDIEIIPTKQKKISNEGIEDYMLNKEQVIICSTLDNIKRVCYIQKGTHPPIKKLFEKQIYNPITKTGLYTEEFLKTMYYERNTLLAL